MNKNLERIIKLGKIQRQLRAVFNKSENPKIKELTRKTMNHLAWIMAFLAREEE